VDQQVGDQPIELCGVILQPLQIRVRLEAGQRYAPVDAALDGAAFL